MIFSVILKKISRNNHIFINIHELFIVTRFLYHDEIVSHIVCIRGFYIGTI